MRNRATLSPMNLMATKPMTLAEFLVWEERQALRYEFDGSSPSQWPAEASPMPPFNAILRWRSEAGCDDNEQTPPAA